MTVRHRRLHLVLWLILGPLILIGFALGLSARRDVPVESYAPDNAATQTGATP